MLVPNIYEGLALPVCSRTSQNSTSCDEAEGQRDSTLVSANFWPGGVQVCVKWTVMAGVTVFREFCQPPACSSGLVYIPAHLTSSRSGITHSLAAVCFSSGCLTSLCLSLYHPSPLHGHHNLLLRSSGGTCQA